MVEYWTEDMKSLPFDFDTLNDVVEVCVKGKANREVDVKFMVKAGLVLKFDSKWANVDVSQLVSLPWAALEPINFQMKYEEALSCFLKVLLLDFLFGVLGTKYRKKYYELLFDAPVKKGKKTWPSISQFFVNFGKDTYLSSAWV